MRCIYDGLHPCGRCPACMLNRQRAFCFRLDQEKENASYYFWLTLQYDEDHVPTLINDEGEKEMCFSKEHCHIFFEKLRSRYKKDNVTFKHFLVSEYGPNKTHRPHYHCLLLAYCNSTNVVDLYKQRQEMRDFIIHESWPHGFVCEKSFHGRVISYLTKYCLKPELLGQKHTMKPFSLISRGIGLSYLDNLSEHKKQQMIKNLDFNVTYEGKNFALPRYYVDKLLPHSLQNLRDLMPENFEDQAAWSAYDQLQLIRSSLAKKNEALGRKSAINRQWKETFEERQNRIDYELSKFRAKVKLRKDL